MGIRTKAMVAVAMQDGQHAEEDGQGRLPGGGEGTMGHGREPNGEAGEQDTSEDQTLR